MIGGRHLSYTADQRPAKPIGEDQLTALDTGACSVGPGNGRLSRYSSGVTYLTLPPTGAAEAKPLLNITFLLAALKALREVPANNLGRTIVKKNFGLRFLSSEKKIQSCPYMNFSLFWQPGREWAALANGSAGTTPGHRFPPARVFIGGAAITRRRPAARLVADRGASAANRDIQITLPFFTYLIT